MARGIQLPLLVARAAYPGGNTRIARVEDKVACNPRVLDNTHQLVANLQRRFCATYGLPCPSYCLREISFPCTLTGLEFRIRVSVRAFPFYFSKSCIIVGLKYQV